MRPDYQRGRSLVVASGVLGPLMLGAYFVAPLFAAPLGRLIYAAHPPTAEVVDIGTRYHELLYAGGWLQVTGALLAVIFFLALATMASAPESLAAKIVQLGSAVLVAMVLAEVVFTITWVAAAVNGQVASSRASFDLMAAFIRVFPIVPVPALSTRGSGWLTNTPSGKYSFHCQPTFSRKEKANDRPHHHR
jgi:sulfur carrier protein ThiS